ncbi:hypothetical protein SAMN05421593_2394 [Chryseobacterium culicis]|uniref:Uncharacterized protein n=1 Tax=Chryseobacterium culicis TaxID=680127 RepID=A0A1H6HHR8_CHRCI|nr:hypothetical protein SAMN05421593_2394 [Chryseobacterium culicis]
MDNDKKYYLKFYTLHSSGSLNLNAVLIIESKFHIYFFYDSKKHTDESKVSRQTQGTPSAL